ncbi:unnamed protein product, partial [Rotaria magnacalcarata]
WCWQDEYQGLTLADIRHLEDETQRELNKRMANFQSQDISLSITNDNAGDDNTMTIVNNELNQPLSSIRNRQLSIDNINANRSRINTFPIPPLPRDETGDDEYFDAESHIDALASSRSFRNLKLSSANERLLRSVDDDERTYVSLSSDDGDNVCSIGYLILIFYGGNVFSTEDSFESAKQTDFLTIRTTFDTVIRNHYSHIEGKLAIRFVECPSICIETINLLNSLSPYGITSLSYDIAHSETMPINAIPLFAIANPNYQTTLNYVIESANKVYKEFLISKEGKYFSGQVKA